jgi:serine O-acetyltransferase
MTFREIVAEDAAWYGCSALRALRFRTFRPVATLRLVQHTRGPVRLAARVLHHWACQRAGIDLWPTTQIAPGFRITHGWGAVVNPKAVIGRDVVMMHGVTLGQAGRLGAAPIIGDRVLLGAGCAVLGKVTVGDGATISAGAVVTEDVPPDTLVFAAGGLSTRPLLRPFGKQNPAPS